LDDGDFWGWLKELQLYRLMQGSLIGGMTCEEYVENTILKPTPSEISESPRIRLIPPQTGLTLEDESSILDYED